MPRGRQSATISTPSRSSQSQRCRLARGSRHTCAPRGMGCACALCAMRAKQRANERATHSDREPRTSRSLREATASAARTVEVSRSSCSFPRPDSQYPHAFIFFQGPPCALSERLDSRSFAHALARSHAIIAAPARVSRQSGASGRPVRWLWPSEKRGRRWIDLLEACQLLGACCVGIRRGHQSGRSAPTLNTLSCSVTSTEPACVQWQYGTTGDCRSPLL